MFTFFLPQHFDVRLNGPSDDVDELRGRDDASVEVDPEGGRRVGNGHDRVRSRDGEGRVQIPDARVDSHAIVRSERSN